MKEDIKQKIEEIKQNGQIAQIQNTIRAEFRKIFNEIESVLQADKNKTNNLEETITFIRQTLDFIEKLNEALLEIYKSLIP